MTKDEETVTKILLSLSQLSGQMIESSQTNVVIINEDPTLFIDPKWMKATGEFIAKNCQNLSHLISAIANENSSE